MSNPEIPDCIWVGISHPLTDVHTGGSFQGGPCRTASWKRGVDWNSSVITSAQVTVPRGGRPKVMKGGQEGGGPVRASGNAIQVPKGLVISERSFVKETIPVVQMGGPSGRTCSLVLW